MQDKKQQLQAGKEAHLHLAQVALKHMDEEISKSKRAYELIKRFRRLMIFHPDRRRRYQYKIMWLLGMLVRLEILQ